MFGALERGVMMGRGNQEKERITCVNSDTRAFSIQG